jgi:hypothetical protein
MGPLTAHQMVSLQDLWALLDEFNRPSQHLSGAPMCIVIKYGDFLSFIPQDWLIPQVGCRLPRSSATRFR